MLKKAATTIYIDGACSNNGSRRARASVGVYFGPNDPRNYAGLLKGQQTNNRAEISAAIVALLRTKPNEDVILYTDSVYLRQSITEWIFRWQANGWRTANKKAVQNVDLFQKLLEIQNEKKEHGSMVDWKWVKGHGSVEGNIMADKLATDILQEVGGQLEHCDPLNYQFYENLYGKNKVVKNSQREPTTNQRVNSTLNQTTSSVNHNTTQGTPGSNEVTIKQDPLHSAPSTLHKFLPPVSNTRPTFNRGQDSLSHPTPSLDEHLPEQNREVPVPNPTVHEPKSTSASTANEIESTRQIRNETKEAVANTLKVMLRDSYVEVRIGENMVGNQLKFDIGEFEVIVKSKSK